MKRTNLRKTLIAAALVGGTLVGTSALADPIDVEVVWKSYYIVEDTATNRCRVGDVKPTPDGVPALAYESRDLADTALAEASAYETLECSYTAMSEDGRDDETTPPTVTADSSASEQRDIAPDP